MKKLLLALCCVPNLCFAHNIKLNKVLPQVEVKTHGQLLLKDMMLYTKNGIQNSYKEK